MLLKAEIAEVIAEPPAHQEFEREIVEAFDGLLLVALFSFQRSVDQKISNGEGNRLEEFAGGEVVLRPGQSVTNMSQNGLPQRLRIGYCCIARESCGHSELWIPFRYSKYCISSHLHALSETL